MTRTTTTPGATIVIERTFDASPEFLFKAFTDPAMLEQWWGPHQYGTRHWTIDLRVGGVFRYEMYEVASNKGHWCSGVYSVVDPNARLTSTANIEWEPGSNIPEIDEMTIDIQFIPEGSKTRVVATQSNLPDAGWGENASQGWSQQLVKLETLLAGQK